MDHDVLFVILFDSSPGLPRSKRVIKSEWKRRVRVLTAEDDGETMEKTLMSEGQSLIGPKILYNVLVVLGDL